VGVFTPPVGWDSLTGMSGAILTAEDRAHLLRMMRRQTPSPVHRRMNALLLLDDGWAVERVAVALFIDAETVREHRRLYQTSGIAGVERLTYEGSEPALSREQLTALERELDSRLYMTAKAVCEFARRTFEVGYTPNAMTKLLKRLGFVYKMPKCVPAKADAAVQQRFVEQTLAPLMARADSENPLYFVDATHPSYTAHPSHGWIRKGETRELKSNHGRVNVNINGALRWPDRMVVHREADKITSAEMIALFRQAGSLASAGHRDPRRAGQCPLQSFGRDQGLCVSRRLPHPAGLPAGLCAEPQPDRAAVVVVQAQDALQPALPNLRPVQSGGGRLLQQYRQLPQ